MSIIDDTRRGEGHELDFKRLPNRERIKCLKPVVAFANSLCVVA